MSARGVVLCGVAAVLFGASAPFASRLAGDLGAFALAGLLYLGAALAVLPIVGRGWPSARALRRSGSRLAIAVLVGGAVGPVLLAAGLAHVSAATASLLLNLELVFTLVVAAVLFGEHIGRRVVIGGLLVVVAGIVLAWSPSADLRWGAALISAACLCWAFDNCITASLDDLAPAHITLAKGAVAGGASLAIGLVLSGAPPVSAALGALAVGAVGYGLSITLWVAGARELGAARGQLVFAAAPFVGVIVAWTVLGDAVTGREIVSSIIAAAGVSFVLYSAHSHEHRHPPIVHDHAHLHDEHHGHVHEDGFRGRHQHEHTHAELVHRHPHVPDLHHRHEHD